MAPVETEQRNSKAILILEDDGVLRKHLARFLGRRGFDVTTTASVREFRQSLTSSRFTAVLLDLSLPDGDGVEAWCENREHLPDATALLMTAQSCAAVEERADRAGIAAVLDKPFRVTDLLALLDKPVAVDY